MKPRLDTYTLSKLGLLAILVVCACCFAGGEGLVVSVIFIAVCIVGITYYNTTQNKMHAARMKDYDQGLARWSRLYYCHRCDLVIEPERHD